MDEHTAFGVRVAETDDARDRGTHKVVLEVWPHNCVAIALYERHGFVREGLRPGHYRRRNGELWDSLEMGPRLE
ncbi:MAG: hypothetical protein SW127_04545 [Actinomycetota bacterium]|nr:hypothetical protein [Actinomycetota bacterium]